MNPKILNEYLLSPEIPKLWFWMKHPHCIWIYSHAIHSLLQQEADDPGPDCDDDEDVDKDDEKTYEGKVR